MGISSPGIGSGLDVNAIVDKLMSIEQRPLKLLDKKEAAYQVKLTAFGNLQAALSAYGTTLKSVNVEAGFRGMTTSVADSSVLTAQTSTKAVAGQYSVEVTQLAQAHKVKSAGVSDVNAALGSGTLTFQFGTYDSGLNTFTLNPDKPSQVVTIGAGQNTMSGIRDAINAAGIGVSASIVNDGGASGNRLVITSKDTGKASSIKVTVAEDGTAPNDANNTNMTGLSQLAYDPTLVAGSGKNLTETATALDATLKVDGISITKTKNTITDAIEGVTLNLLKTNVAAPTTLTVAKDTGGVTGKVQAFVNAFNALNKAAKDLSSSDLNKPGPLEGDVTLLTIMNRVKAELNTPVVTTGPFSRLADVGVSFQRDGTLSLDSAKLSKVMDTNYADVATVFAAVGKATDAQVSFVSATSSTQPGSYPLSITTAATQATTVGSAAPTSLTIVAGVNDTLSVTLETTTATVTLGAGVYANAAALAAELQSRINGSATFVTAGKSATASVDGGNIITLKSARYGSDSRAAIAAGAARDNLLGGAPTEVAGVDVAGTLNLVAGTGSGQTLTGVDGLKIQVAGTATGARGTVSYSLGVAAKLDTLISSLTSSTGPVATRQQGIDSAVKLIDKQRTELNRRLAATEQHYRDQFTKLDTLMSGLQATSSFLTNQLKNLPGFTSKQ